MSLRQVAWLFVAGVLIADSLSADEPAAKPRKKPDVGYYPTTQDVIEEIYKQVKVTKNDVVCDLGCGDGRFPITAAKIYGCRAMGYEISPEWLQKARDRVKQDHLEKLVEIRDQDFFTADLKEVTVLTLFLLPELNDRLVPQIDKMPKGARIITHEFDIPSLVPDREAVFVSKQDESEHLLYYYTVPLKKRN